MLSRKIVSIMMIAFFAACFPRVALADDEPQLPGGSSPTEVSLPQMDESSRLGESDDARNDSAEEGDAPEAAEKTLEDGSWFLTPSGADFAVLCEGPSSSLARDSFSNSADQKLSFAYTESGYLVESPSGLRLSAADGAVAFAEEGTLWEAVPVEGGYLLASTDGGLVGLDGEGRAVLVELEEDALVLNITDLPLPKSNRLADDGVYSLVSALGSSRAVDMTASSEAHPVLWDRSASKLWQCVFLRWDSGGYYTLESLQTGAYLAASGTSPDSRVTQSSDPSDPGARWILLDAGDGSFCLVSAISGLVLDVSGAEDANGAGLCTWKHKGGSANQLFRLDSRNLLGGGYYSATTAYSSALSIDVHHASQSEGAAAIVWTGKASLNQRFLVRDNGDGTVSLQAAHSAMHLAAASADGGAVVAQSSDRSSDLARWIAKKRADGTFKFVSAADSSLVLDVAGGASGEGAILELWADKASSDSNQRFSMSPATVVPDGYYAVSSAADPSLFLDVTGVSSEDCARLGLWPWNDGANQKFFVKNLSSGRLHITAAHSSKALDVLWPTADVGQFAGASWKDNQQWELVPAGNHAFSLRSASEGLVLDAASGAAGKGELMVVAPASGSASQAFSFSPTTYDPSQIKLDVPCIFQYPELPTGCESVALTNVLLYRGFNLSKAELADKWIPRSSYDFVMCFWGNPHSPSGNSIAAPGLTAAANKYLESQGSSLRAHDVSGKPLSSLYTYVKSGNPVIVWSTINQQRIGPCYGTQLYNGKKYSVYTNSHTVVLRGYDLKNNMVYLADSISGYVACDASWFAMTYTTRGSQAVVIK